MSIFYEGYVKNTPMDRILNELHSHAPEGARRVTINYEGNVYLGWACPDEDVAVAVKSDPESLDPLPWFLIQEGDGITVFDSGEYEFELPPGAQPVKVFIKYVAEIALSFIEDKRNRENREKYYRMLQTHYDVTRTTETLERKNR